jgi:hypothetical protein
MASVLDSVAPPSAQLVGESIRVHDDFFGDVNVKLLSICPDLISLASRCFYLPHIFLPHRARQVFSIPASAILRSGQTLVSLRESKNRLNPVIFALEEESAFRHVSIGRSVPQYRSGNDSASIFVFAKFIGAIISGRA